MVNKWWPDEFDHKMSFVGIRPDVHSARLKDTVANLMLFSLSPSTLLHTLLYELSKSVEQPSINNTSPSCGQKTNKWPEPDK